jgi:hypothetical protein
VRASRGSDKYYTPSLVEEDAPFQERHKNMVMSPDGAGNQERLCWREPAAIYWTGLTRCCVSRMAWQEVESEWLQLQFLDGG